MYILRLLFLSLLMVLWIAPAAAQSPQDKSSVSSQLQPDRLIAPPEFRRHVAATDPNEPSRIDDLRLLPFDPSLVEDDTTCYSIRSYRLTRDDPQSDSTRLAGYSECQPATRFQVRAAAGSQGVSEPSIRKFPTTATPVR